MLRRVACGWTAGKPPPLSQARSFPPGIPRSGPGPHVCSQHGCLQSRQFLWWETGEIGTSALLCGLSSKTLRELQVFFVVLHVVQFVLEAKGYCHQFQNLKNVMGKEEKGDF